jgi:F0F1-type ATP synthase membrane subunit b/b'
MTIENAWDNIDSATQRLKAIQIEITVLIGKEREQFHALAFESLKKDDNTLIAQVTESMNVSAALISTFSGTLRSTNDQVAEARDLMEEDDPTTPEMLRHGLEMIEQAIEQASAVRSHLIESLGHLSDSARSYRSDG